MSKPRKSVKTIFGEALEIPSPDERARYLDEACAGNESFRAEVEDLLSAIERAGSFLGGSPVADATTSSPIAEKPGTVIGPYKLLQQIGEGGMGVVYMAEQTEPVKRRVAIKIIKPEMDTRRMVARFEAERNALSMMDHPNIARVLDAGTTDSGRPYFVMEVVKGVPIIQFCDEHHLGVRQRLETPMHKRSPVPRAEPARRTAQHANSSPRPAPSEQQSARHPRADLPILCGKAEINPGGFCTESSPEIALGGRIEVGLGPGGLRQAAPRRELAYALPDPTSYLRIAHVHADRQPKSRRIAVGALLALARASSSAIRLASAELGREALRGISDGCVEMPTATTGRRTLRLAATHRTAALK